MPEAIDRHLADDSGSGGVQQLRNILPNEGDAEDDFALLVNDHARVSFVAVGLHRRAGYPTEVVVHHADVVASLHRGLRGESHRRDLWVAERHLGHHLVVGSRRVLSEAVVVHTRAEGACRDHVSGRPRLVLALMGEQRAVVDVAAGIEPVEALHQHGVVHLHPVAGGQADVLEAQVIGARQTSGGDEHLVGDDC